MLFTSYLKELVVPEGLGIFVYFYIMQLCSHTHGCTSTSTTERSAGISSFSPLSQHDNCGLGPTSLAEGEELLDDLLGFVHKLLVAELQLFVALENRRLHLPEVLYGRCVQSVECW